MVRAADDLFIAYHRPSGETHVLAPEMLAILDCIDGQPRDAAGIVAALAATHDIEVEGGDSAAAIVAARLDELVILGLADTLT